jgi:predicted amidohydrolase YtcJ
MPAAAAETPATVEAGSEVADVVYLNGKIYNEAQPWAEAVAIKDGRFAAWDRSIRSCYSRRFNTE